MKPQLVVVLLMLIGLSSTAQPIYRCTDAAGRVTMQQSPCAAASTGEIIGSSRAAPTARAPARSEQQSADHEPRRHWIVWTGDPRLDVAKAIANLDAIRLLGSRCDIELRIRSGDSTDCRRFLQQLAPGGDFPLIGEKLQDIIHDRSAAQQVDAYDWRRVERITREIAERKEFVLAALKQR